MNQFLGIIGLALACLLYCAPLLVADHRKHHNASAITLLNLLLGWTFVGWVVALVWAATEVRTPGQLPGGSAAPGGGRPTVPAPSPLDTLPQSVIDELYARLIRSGFSDYEGHTAWLREEGYEVSRMAVAQRARQFRERWQEFLAQGAPPAA